MQAMQAASVASLAVLTAMLGFKFGLFMGVITLILSFIVYAYSGLGKKSSVRATSTSFLLVHVLTSCTGYRQC